MRLLVLFSLLCTILRLRAFTAPRFSVQQLQLVPRHYLQQRPLYAICSNSDSSSNGSSGKKASAFTRSGLQQLLHHKVLKTCNSWGQALRRRWGALACALLVILTPTTRVLASTLTTAAAAAAAAGAPTAAKGYDLYGRLPYDDWLFSTYKLVDPNLLKRSFTEVIVQELPFVLSNFKKRKLLNEVQVVVKSIIYVAIAVAFINYLYQNAIDSLRKSRREGEAVFSASAISKKGPRKGRQIEGMEEGWLDMELSSDDDFPTDKPKGKRKPPKKPDPDDDVFDDDDE